MLEDQSKNIQIIQGRNSRWLNIASPTKKDIKYLRDNFHFHDLDLEDVLAVTQRSKVDRYSQYIFAVILLPLYNRKYRSIEKTEVDFFISQKTIITIHRGAIDPLTDLFSLCQLQGPERKICFETGVSNLLYQILNRLWKYCFPMLDHMSSDINTLERQIFLGNEKKMVEDILIIRRNIIMFRTLMQPHRHVLQKFMLPSKKNGDFTLIQNQNDLIFFDDLMDHVKEIWDALSTLKESVEALAQTNESLISFRIDDTIKFLTLISVILLPLSLLVEIFSIKSKANPLLGNPFDFWIIILVLIIVSSLMVLFFRKKRLF